MTVPMVDPALGLILRGALSVLFGWAASHKLRDVAAFREALANYDLLPRRRLTPAALLLIAMEIGVAVALWLPRRGPSAALAAAGLLGLYAGAIVVNLIRGRYDIDCGCTGAAGRQPLSAALAARNGLLIAAALASALPATARSLTWVDGLTVGFGVTMLALLYAAVDGLLALAPRVANRLRGRAPDPSVQSAGVAHA